MISKIGACCYKILPLVYDQTLSYYETLCKVVDKINEVIDYVDNKLVERIETLVSDVIIEDSYDAETETLTITLDVSRGE